MPFRKTKLKDSATNKDMLDDYGEPMYEDEKFLPFFLGNTKEEAEDMYARYKKTISVLANKYSIYNNVDEKDLIQEGTIGLARAMRDFDNGRSSNFSIFAIYKIKDAMREFVSKQASDIKIPQYIKEATRLIEKLSKLIEKVSPTKEIDFGTTWVESSLFDGKSAIVKDISEVRDSIANLAERAGTTVEQLLERAELYPADKTDIDDIVTSMDDIMDISKVSSEEISAGSIVKEAMNREFMAKLTGYAEYDEYEDYVEYVKSVEQLPEGKKKQDLLDRLNKFIAPKDLQLLYDHYVKGMTVRQLEPIIGIRAASITVRIHTILKSLQKKKEQILMS